MHRLLARAVRSTGPSLSVRTIKRPFLRPLLLSRQSRALSITERIKRFIVPRQLFKQEVDHRPIFIDPQCRKDDDEVVWMLSLDVGIPESEYETIKDELIERLMALSDSSECKEHSGHGATTVMTVEHIEVAMLH